MILNMVDNRKLPYRWKRVKAAIEPTWHDNKCKDSDQAEASQNELDYNERADLSVADAIKWADQFPFSVTLYLYDLET
jgi:hypothetical protein